MKMKDMNKLVVEVVEDLLMEDSDAEAVKYHADELALNGYRYRDSTFDGLLNAYHYHMSLSERKDRKNDMAGAGIAMLTAYYIREIMRERIA